MTTEVAPPVLHLFADCLLSKWGFGDGDSPDHLLDYWDDVDTAVDYNAFHWHPVLILLVRRHLVPALERRHVIEVEEIGTCHNPIRARTVDGVEIDHYRSSFDTPQVALLPESVTVTYDQIMEAVRAVLAASAAS